MRVWQPEGGNLGGKKPVMSKSCRHVMCAAGFAAAHDRRTLTPHFPIHECTRWTGMLVGQIAA